jgi:hypothetical protein
LRLVEINQSERVWEDRHRYVCNAKSRVVFESKGVSHQVTPEKNSFEFSALVTHNNSLQHFSLLCKKNDSCFDEKEIKPYLL